MAITHTDAQHDLVQQINRYYHRDKGNANYGDSIKWTQYGGPDFQQITRQTAGNHLAVLLAATSATASPGASNSVLLVQDAAVSIGAGKNLTLYNAAGTNGATLVHSGTNDVAKATGGLQVAGALNVGASISATDAGDGFMSGGLSLGTYVNPAAGDLVLSHALNVGDSLSATDTGDAWIKSGVSVGTFNNPGVGEVRASNRVGIGSGLAPTSPLHASDTFSGWLAQLNQAGSTAGTHKGVLVSSANTTAADPVFEVDTSSTQRFGVYGGGLVGIGDNADAFMTVGLVINQSGNDDEILSFKSSDVAHGITDFTETDTFGYFSKLAANTGGLLITGAAETGGTKSAGIFMQGFATDNDTTRATTSGAAIYLAGDLKSGTGVTAMGANAGLVAFGNGTTTRLILDAEGDLHLDATSNANAWDDHDDVELLEAFRLTTMREEPKNFKRLFSEDITRHAQTLHDTGVITLNEDGHHFVSRKGLDGLLIDSIRQLYGALLETQAEVRVLRQRVLP